MSRGLVPAPLRLPLLARPSVVRRRARIPWAASWVSARIPGARTRPITHPPTLIRDLRSCRS